MHALPTEELRDGDTRQGARDKARGAGAPRRD
jgi:hypothetical protein